MWIERSRIILEKCIYLNGFQFYSFAFVFTFTSYSDKFQL